MHGMGTTRAAWQDGARGAEIAQAWGELVRALIATRPPEYMRNRFGDDMSDLGLLIEDARNVMSFAAGRIMKAGNSVESAAVMLEAHRAAERFVELATSGKARAA